jgi:hypothetical protein
VVGVAGAATLAPVTFAAAAEASPQTKTITGHFDIGVPDFVYLPVEVPRGVRQLDVSYSYDRPAVPPGVLGNALDIGIFDQRGHQLATAPASAAGPAGSAPASASATRRPRPATCPGRSVLGPGTWCSAPTRSRRRA